ncbi:MAG: hypothetical protein ABFC80_03880 [Coriobacteriales bacterium]|nr:hypothetical protein [Actinomycetes bacterium]
MEQMLARVAREAHNVDTEYWSVTEKRTAPTVALQYCRSTVRPGGAVPLAATHSGWENEHLATYLLSRVAFVASPLKVADDVGTDLFCTLFERVKPDATELLVPRNSIAVQLKSSRDDLRLKPWQIEYLARLEIPYYVGVVDQSQMTLTLFSARYLPMLITFRGRHSVLTLELVDELDGAYRKGDDESGYSLLCPMVGSFCATDSLGQAQTTAATLRQDARDGLKAIASRLNAEYIFDTLNGVEIFAGADSAKTFGENFMRRLAEALYNMAWLLNNHEPVTCAEVDFYLETYDRLEAMVDGEPLPAYLQAARVELESAPRPPV